MGIRKWEGIPRYCYRCGEPVNSYYWPLRLWVHCQKCVRELEEKGITVHRSRRWAVEKGL